MSPYGALFGKVSSNKCTFMWSFLIISRLIHLQKWFCCVCGWQMTSIALCYSFATVCECVCNVFGMSFGDSGIVGRLSRA